MKKTKSPVSASTLTGRNVERTNQQTNDSFTYANFNDNTALHIFQVLADLLAEQEGLEPVKLSLKEKEA